MATKDSLTRDEAREAIKILALRKDNSDNLLIGLTAIDIAVFAISIALIPTFPSLSTLNGLFFIVFVTIVVVIWVAVFYILLLIRRAIKSERSKSEHIKSRMDELARRYDLEEFKHTITNENEWQGHII